jgi:hypothetical protein
MKKGLLLAGLYGVSAFLNLGLINADVKGRVILPCYVETPRHRYAAAVGEALLPVAGTMIALFGTGFGEAGFDWTVGGCS